MKKSVFGAIVLVGLALLALAGIKVLQFRKLMAAGKSFAPPPESVSTVVVKEATWQSTLPAVGSITAVQGVNVTSELPGVIREIAFDSGAVAKAGDLLIRLDTSAEEAQLRSLQAQADLAQIEAARRRKLRADKMISESDLDSAEAALKQAIANADAVQASITKKTIRAPFAGELGLRLVNLGEYLDPGKPIVSLQSLNTVYADFSLPQQDLPQLKTGMAVRVATDADPSTGLKGKLIAINPDVDPTTRSVRLRASFDNPDGRLRPGMFARVEVVLPEQKPVLVIPTTALLDAAYGQSVFLVEAGTNGHSQVKQQFIRAGQSRGDLVAVQSGLKVGQRIVSAGAFKLRSGMAVTENNSLDPQPKEKPQPADG